MPSSIADGAPGSLAWHALPAGEVVSRLGSNAEQGLDPDEARRRLARVGPNRIAGHPEASLWRLGLRQFRSVVVLLLLAATGIAWGLGELEEALAILAALLINAAIGFGTEWRAQVSLAKLRSLVVPRAVVWRGGRVLRVQAAELVPGDLIVLEAGAHVPADARLVSAAALRVNEAALTGESEPVSKAADALVDRGAVLADRRTMVYLATTVLAGSGLAVVTATGAATELGRIGQLVALAGERQTPLEQQIEWLGRRLIVLALGICAVVAGVGVFHGEPGVLMLETAISLAIAAIPEGLPAMTAAALATGLWRLARAGALVRSLPAVEALGSTTVICADKTGTMTENRMTVARILLGPRVIVVTGEAASPRGEFLEDGRRLDPDADAALHALLTAAVLANDAAVEIEEARLTLHGDPTEAALLVAALKAGLDPKALARPWPRRREIPFDPTRRFMATLHEAADGRRLLCVKGAPEEIIGRSVAHDAEREALLAANRSLAGEGFRVLAVAWRTGDGVLGLSPERLTLLGLVALHDPVRPGVREAIEHCAQAGIRTMMLTGDQAWTAQAVGRQLGIPPGEIRSRVSPEDKLSLVTALQGRGEIVAMTGDGVNDAPALARADIGVAMGRHGTDVAREAADIVLTDDNFATIVRAVEEGRVIYANLRKVIRFLFSCNLSEILTIFVAIALGLPAPLLPLQILWVNIVTDILPAVALIRDPAEPDVMRRRPRRADAAFLTLAVAGRVLLEGALLAAGVLSAYLLVVWQEGAGARAGTVAFLTLVLVQPFQAMNCRSEALGWWRLPANPLAWLSLVVLAGAQYLATSWSPLAHLLGTVPLSPSDWLVGTGAALWPVVVLEAVKALGQPRE